MPVRMNLLDRAVGFFDPAAGIRRAAARAALDRLAGKGPTAYAAGTRNGRTAGWRAPPGGPNRASLPYLAVLRDRSRQMVRDNPYAASAVEKRADYEVGTGIVVRWADDRAQKLWDGWIAQCDHAGLLDLDAMMGLGARARSQDGEAFLIERRLTGPEMRARGMAVPLTLELAEADVLPELRPLSEAPTTNPIVGGIEFDAVTGLRRRYWMRRYHPGDTRAAGPGGDLLDGIPAEQVIHIFRPLRPGMQRGMPDCASVLLRLRQLDDFEDAVLQQAISQALLGVFFKTDGAQIAPPMKADGTPAEVALPSFDLEPGMVQALPPGFEPVFLQPNGSPALPAYALHQLMAASAGWGVPYDILTGDLRQANYSSLRAGRLGFKRQTDRMQWGVWVPTMRRVVASFVTMAKVVGALPAGFVADVEYAPPRFEMLDPAAEIEGMILAIRAGLMTWDQAVAELGWDPKKQIGLIAAVNARLDAAGVILDTDPRRVARVGNAQDAKQNAAVELGPKGGPARRGNGGGSGEPAARGAPPDRPFSRAAR